MKNKFSKLIGLIAAIGFIFNLIWENAQAPLYANYSGFSEHFLICLGATFGDVIIVLSIYILVSFAKADWHWPVHMGKRAVTLTIILGLLVAIIIEQGALLLGLWGYADQMPRLPFFNVGFLPTLQMLILPTVTFWMSSFIYKKL